MQLQDSALANNEHKNVHSNTELIKLDRQDNSVEVELRKPV